MIDFKVCQTTCIKCGQCVSDCPARIIAMENGNPFITQEKEALCYKCQHCLSVCPTASISILGYDPQNSLPLTGTLPDSAQMEDGTVTATGQRQNLLNQKAKQLQQLEPELPKQGLQRKLNQQSQARQRLQYRL